MSKCWVKLVLDLKSQSLLHVLSDPCSNLFQSRRHKTLFCRRLTLGYELPIVFSCFDLGYSCATFVCSPRVAQGRHFVDRSLVEQEKNVRKCLSLGLISFWV